MHKNKKLLRLCGVFLLVLIGEFLLTACSTSRPLPLEEGTPRVEKPPESSRPTPTLYPTSRTIPTRPPTTSAPSIATSTPSDLAALRVYTITVQDVETAFWSDDGQTIYYAQKFSPGERLRWAAYDLQTHLTVTVTSPRRYDPNIPQRLTIPGLSGYDDYPNIWGYVSPSGRSAIFTLEYGHPTLLSRAPHARTEIWLINLTSRQRTKLLEVPVGRISDVVWFRKETKVIFDLGWEGGVDLYIGDTENSTLISLNDFSDFPRGTDQIWSVSPDGATLAVIDFAYRLWLISLVDGKSRIIEQVTRYPHWSKDGKFLYYWWGPSFDEAGTLHVLNTSSGIISTLLSRSSLEATFKGIPALGFGDYAVSPDEDKVLLWGGPLWLVELIK